MEKEYYDIGIEWGDTFRAIDKLATDLKNNRILVEGLRTELSKYKKELADIKKAEDFATAAGQAKYEAVITKITQTELSLRSATKAQKELHKSFDQMTAPGKTLAELIAKGEELAASLRLSSTPIKELKKGSLELKKVLDNLSPDSDEFKRFNGQLAETQNRIKFLGREDFPKDSIVAFREAIEQMQQRLERMSRTDAGFEKLKNEIAAAKAELKSLGEVKTPERTLGQLIERGEQLAASLRLSNTPVAELKKGAAELKTILENLAPDSDEFKRFNAQLTETQNRIKQLGKEQVPTDSIAAFRREVTQMQADLMKMSRTDPGFDDFKRKVAAARLELIAFDSSINDGRTNVGRYAQSFQQGFAASAAAVAGLVGVSAGIQGVTQVVGFAIGKYKDFTFQMSAAKAVMISATKEEIVALEALARKLGEDTQYTAAQAAEAIQYLGMAGFNANQVMSALPKTLALAASTGLELGQAADIASNILSGFRLSAEETGRVVDVMAFTTTRFNTNAMELGEAMKFIAPAAAALNVPLEEVSTFIGAMGNNALKSGEATRSLTSSLGRLAKATPEMEAVMKNLNVDFFDSQGNFVGLTEAVSQLEVAYKKLTPEQQLASTQVLFGAEAAKNITAALGFQKEEMIDGELVTLKGAEALRYYTEQTKKAAEEGTIAAEMAAIRQDNLTGDIEKLSSAVEGAAISFAETGSGGLRSFIQSITELIPTIQKVVSIIGTLVFGGLSILFNILTAMPKFVRENRAVFILLGIALVALNANMIALQVATLRKAAADKIALISTKSLTLAQRALNFAMTANPIGLVIAALAILIATFINVYKYSETFRKGVDNLTKKFLEFYDKNILVKAALFTLVEPIKIIIRAFKDGVHSIGGFVGAFQQMRQNVSAGIDLIILKAKKLSLSLRSTFSFGNSKEQLTKDLKAIERQIEATSGKVKSIGEAYADGVANSKVKSVTVEVKKKKAEDAKAKADEKVLLGNPTPMQGFEGDSSFDVGRSAKQRRDEAKQKADEAVRAAKEEAERKKQIAADAAAQIEDLEIASIKDTAKRKEAELRLAAKRQIEGIKAEGEQRATLEKLINEKLTADLAALAEETEAEAQKKKIESLNAGFELLKTIQIEAQQQGIITEAEYQDNILQLTIDRITQEMLLTKEGTNEYLQLRQQLAEALMQQDENEKAQRQKLREDELKKKIDDEQASYLEERKIAQQRFLDGIIDKEQLDEELLELDQANQDFLFNTRMEAIQAELDQKLIAHDREKELLAELGELNKEYFDNKIAQAQAAAAAELKAEEEKRDTLAKIRQAGFDFAKGLSDLILQVEMNNAGENEAEQRAATRRAAIRTRNIAMFEAAINTGIAVTSAMKAPPGPPLSFIIAGLTAAKGAVEIGLIAARPLPQLARGGYNDNGIKGHKISRAATQSGGYYPNFRPHSQGGTVVEMAQNEMAVTPTAGKDRRARSVVSSINALYGGVTYPDTEPLPPSVTAPLFTYLNRPLNVPITAQPQSIAPSIARRVIPKAAAGIYATGTTNGTLNDPELNRAMQEQNNLLRMQVELLRQNKTVQIDELNETSRRQALYGELGRA